MTIHIFEKKNGGIDNYVTFDKNSEWRQTLGNSFPHLCFTADTTAVPTERNQLLLVDNGPQKPVGTTQRHVFDGASRFTCVLEMHAEI